MQSPAAFAVQGQHQVVEGHKGRPVADRHAGAAHLTQHPTEALLHVHLLVGVMSKASTEPEVNLCSLIAGEEKRACKFVGKCTQ